MADPIVDTQWGLVNWVDYEHNWREKDAEYLRDRSINRFHNDTERNAAIPSGAFGSVVYNETSDRLELRSKTSTWLKLEPLPQNLKVETDTPSTVTLAHVAAGGQGISFVDDVAPGDPVIKITGPFDILNGTVKVTTAGIAIKTSSGTTATLSTDADSVVVDKPYKIPKITLTGTGTVLDATGKNIAVGTVTADGITVNNMTLTGTLTGGVLNPNSVTVGAGITLASNKVVASAGFGFTVATTALTGDANKATLQASGKLGKVETTDNVDLSGTLTNLNADTVVRNKTLQWEGGTPPTLRNYAVSVYSAADPGVANFPNGTIWFS